MLAVRGTVVAGHGVASGRAGPVPGGTIRAQLPHFAAAGLDLSGCYPGTINLSLAPRRLLVARPTHTFRDLAWWPGVPAETFSFVPSVVIAPSGPVDAWIYRPHPETKPAHFQPPSVVEILAPWIPGVVVGMPLSLEVDGDRVAMTDSQE